MVRYYIESAVHDSVLDSPRIEGSSEFRIFNNIVLPMIIPAIAAMSLLIFTSTWNNYLVPMLIIDASKESLITLPLLVSMSKGCYSGHNSFVLVVPLLSFIPIFILYLFFSKFFIKGIIIGSIKEL